MRTTPLRRIGHEPAAVATSPYLSFTVHGVTYATALLSVQEVMDLDRLDPVPDAPEALRGSQVLRGHRIPVLDLGTILEERRLRLTRTSCTLVVRGGIVSDDGAPAATLIGLAADGVIGVTGLDPAALVAAPRLGGRDGADLVVAMASTAQGLLPLLEPERILASDDVRRALSVWRAAEAGAAQPVG